MSICRAVLLGHIRLLWCIERYNTMTDEATVIALMQIWPELPELAGPEVWEELREQLRKLLLAYDIASEAFVRAEISMQLQDLLEVAPVPVIDRFDTEFLRISNIHRSPFDVRHQAGEIHKWIIQTVRGASAEGKTSDFKTWTRYTDIACPRRVWIGTKRISVVVRLTLRPSEHSEAAKELALAAQLPVLVRLEAHGFDLLGSAEQEVPLLPDADSSPVVFDLSPHRSGYNDLVFDFFQAGNPVGSLTVTIEVTMSEESIVEQVQRGPELHSGHGVEAPDFILYISYEERPTERMLSFELRPKGEVGERYQPLKLELTPEEYTHQLYRQLTRMAKLPGTVRSLDRENPEEKLREEGEALWRDLIPLELRKRYEREQWRDKSLLIVSDEPYILWELLWPPSDRSDEGPLCIQMPMARWLRRGQQGDMNHEPEALLRLDAMAIIIPSDSGLDAAQRERAMLVQLMEHYGLQDVSPTETTRHALKRFLGLGGYTWLHIAAHGNFYPDDPYAEATIWLQDRQPLTVHVIDATVENHLRKQRPAFFFNACESGRLGQAITGISGWASRLIGAGAGLFLAPQWAVNDQRALKFSERLYPELLQGQTAAQAVRQARIAARLAGDPTWLAYSLYAHPNAHIILESIQK